MDLFAGCGGLSLGLENAGFVPIFVNELHPAARATYLLNRRELEWLSRSENQSGDVLEITQNEAELSGLASRMKREYGEVDLIAGGPPCQGFSGIGHRRSFDVTRHQMPGNHLYREMARIIEKVGPRAFLFENVKGLLSSRWHPEGEKGEIWHDVFSAFEAVQCLKNRRTLGYHVVPGLVHAKTFGVPQNRPRVIIIGIREDLCNQGDVQDQMSALMEPVASIKAPDLIDLLDDLADPMWRKGSTNFYPRSPRTEIQEQFRLSRDGSVLAARGDVLTEQEYSNHSEDIIEKFQFMIGNGGEIPEHMKTKKFAQRVLPKRWGSSGPSITATSLPDDYVHYSLPRTPTVREWARIQTFPDWYQFAGRRTTGGRRRAGDPAAGIWERDVPKYTQIGNAVPVFMAKEIGLAIRNIIG